MKSKGFSFLEILVTLSILGILFIISISTYLTKKNEPQVLIDNIKRAVQYAKVQAVIRGHPVYLSPLNPTLDWGSGMTLTELNEETNKMQLLHQWQWHYRSWRVVWSGANSAGNIRLSNNPMTAISNGTFVLTNMHTNERILLVLNRLGRITLRS